MSKTDNTIIETQKDPTALTGMQWTLLVLLILLLITGVALFFLLSSVTIGIVFGALVVFFSLAFYADYRNEINKIQLTETEILLYKRNRPLSAHIIYPLQEVTVAKDKGKLLLHSERGWLFYKFWVVLVKYDWTNLDALQCFLEKTTDKVNGGKVIADNTIDTLTIESIFDDIDNFITP